MSISGDVPIHNWFLNENPSFLSFRPKGEILYFNNNNTVRFLAKLEMTAFLGFQSGTHLGQVPQKPS